MKNEYMERSQKMVTLEIRVKSSVKKIQRAKPPLSGKNGGCPGLPKGENALKR